MEIFVIINIEERYVPCACSGELFWWWRFEDGLVFREGMHELKLVLIFCKTGSSGGASQWGGENGEVSDSVKFGFLTADKWGYLREKN